MAKLKVPSAQHLARNWKSEPSQICSDLVKLVRYPPRISYSPLFPLIGDILQFGTPKDDIERGIRMKAYREDIQENYLEILSLIYKKLDISYIQHTYLVQERYYPIGRGLKIPFRPPIMHTSNDNLYLPWFSFWKSNPLADRQLALFVSIVRDVMANDPDFEDAGFQILDFSAPIKGGPRKLAFIETESIPSLSADEMREMLDVFAEGFLMAEDALAKGSRENQRQEPSETASDSRQTSIFDTE
jgi:hypothetical protein